MRPNFYAFAVFIIASMMIGCGHKASGFDDQTKEAIQAMARAKSSSPLPAQQMNEALAIYKTGSYQEAVTKLYATRAHTEMTGEQLLALNQAISAVINDLYARAAKGDDQAQAAINESERLRNDR